MKKLLNIVLSILLIMGVFTPMTRVKAEEIPDYVAISSNDSPNIRSAYDEYGMLNYLQHKGYTNGSLDNDIIHVIGNTVKILDDNRVAYCIHGLMVISMPE